MNIIKSKQALSDAIRGLRADGKTIGLVPTMGALHAGHISLVEMAHKYADAVIASIFVNPAQFGPGEDFAQYPRTEKEDAESLEKAGTMIAYLPSVEEMYPRGAITRVTLPGISQELCGAFRPGHFDGVATIVTKLFMQAMPDIAVFGEKDFQQLHIIRQFTRDLDIPVRILGAPVMREPDGLAMSSRNRYLSSDEHFIAASLHRILLHASEQLRKGCVIGVATDEAKQELLNAGFTCVDYVELRDVGSLLPMTALNKPARLLAAAYLGKTRLIDNITVEP